MESLHSAQIILITILKLSLLKILTFKYPNSCRAHSSQIDSGFVLGQIRKLPNCFIVVSTNEDAAKTVHQTFSSSSSREIPLYADLVLDCKSFHLIETLRLKN